MEYCYFNSEIGLLKIYEDQNAICKIEFVTAADKKEKECETPILLEAKKQLCEYFSGKRKSFNLPLNPKGTDFQQRIWKELVSIPYGETRCYKDIALSIGNEKACRAVGMANNKNPIPIIIPCHRVIGKNGSLVGYAGGLDIKQTLLKIERNNKTV